MKNCARGITTIVLGFVIGANIVMTGGNVQAAINKIGITYNGSPIVLEQEPKMNGQSVMLPLRAVASNFGYSVDWQKEQKRIVVEDETHTVVLVIGQMNATIDGENVTLQAAPQIIDNVTYVPLRFIGEAMDMGVQWNSNLKQVELESKYTVDTAHQKLMVLVDHKKQVVGDVVLSKDPEANKPFVSARKTSAGSEIVEVSQTIDGALTQRAFTSFYIKNGKVIDKVSQEASVNVEAGINVEGHIVVANDKSTMRIYDDQTGVCTKTLNYGSFDVRVVKDKYVLGISDHTTQVIDLVTGQKIKILDSITNEADREFVYPKDSPFDTDFVTVAWTGEDAVVFKYYSQSENKTKCVTFKAGQGIVSIADAKEQ